MPLPTFFFLTEKGMLFFYLMTLAVEVVPSV